MKTEASLPPVRVPPATPLSGPRQLQPSPRPARPRGVSAVVLAGMLTWVAGVLLLYFVPPLSEQGWGAFSWGVELGDRRLPWLWPAVLRAAGAIAGAMACVAAAFVAGAAAARVLRLRFAGLAEAVPVCSSLGVGVLAYLGLLLAAAGLYTPTALRVVVGVCLFAGLAWLVARRPARWRWPRPQRPRATTLVWWGVAAISGGVALIGALAPEVEYDAAWFHLPYPQAFLEAGQIVDVSHDFVSLYPLTWELWFGYGLSLGGPVSAKLLHFACLPITAMMLVALVRRFLPRASAWAAVAIFVAAPTVLWEATTAYIDLALALHVTVGIYALMRFLEMRDRPWLWAASLSVGLALATKHLALLVPTLACPMLLVALGRRDRRWGTALGPPITLGLVALAVALPWYTRSYAASGNPVFPELYDLFGGPPERWNPRAEAGLSHFLERFGRPRTWANQLTLPWDLTFHAGRYAGLAGPAFLVLIPLLLLRRRWGWLGWVAVFAGGYFVLWASPLASMQARFLVPIAPLAAALAAAGLWELTARLRRAGGRRAGATAQWAVAAVLMLQLPPFIALHSRDREGWAGWLTHVLHEAPLGVVIGGQPPDRYVARRVRSFDAWRHANTHLPADARVLTWTQDARLYARRDDLWIYSVQAHGVMQPRPGEEAAAAEALRDAALTHLLVSREAWEGERGTHAILGPAARDGWYETLYEDAWFLLLRVRPEALPPRPVQR